MPIVGIASSQVALNIRSRSTGQILFTVYANSNIHNCTRCSGQTFRDNLLLTIRTSSQSLATQRAYDYFGGTRSFNEGTLYLDYQYQSNATIEFTRFIEEAMRSRFNVQPLYQLINQYPRLGPFTTATDTTTTFVLQNSTVDFNGNQAYLYCTYTSMALGSADGCITQGWWVVAYDKITYNGAGQYSYTSDGQTYTGFCSNLIGGFDGNAITFNFYSTFFDTSSTYYGNVTFAISGTSLLQQQQPLVDNFGTYNDTYSFNWQNGNNYDPYTGAYFGGNTTTGTYYDVPLPYYTNGLSGILADSNYFLVYQGNFSYTINLQNPTVQFWGSNQNYNLFSVPDSTGAVNLVFYPASGSRGCYSVTSDNVILQTAPPQTNWSASAFLAQVTKYVDGTLTLLTPSEATAYGVNTSTGTWQIDLLCGANSNTLSVNFYLTQRNYLSPESPTNKYYQDGQPSNGAVLETDVYESYWCSHNGLDFESNFFLGGTSKNYQCHTTPGTNPTTWLRVVMAVGPIGDGTQTSYVYSYYSFDPTTGLPSPTPFDSTTTTIATSSAQNLYPYITSYSPNVNTTSNALGANSVTSQYGNYFYTTAVTGDNLPNTPYPGFSG